MIGGRISAAICASVVHLCAQPALVNTLIGGGTPQLPFSNGVPGRNAAIYKPGGLAVDASGNLFVSDFFGNRVIRIDHQTQIATVLAGTGNAGTDGDGGPATLAALSGPSSLAVDRAGNVYIYESQRIRRVDGATGVISTQLVHSVPYGQNIQMR